ncbi:MAG: hypothetical protein IID33_14430 [Planctomycetes bacterium]|nr:hypothetical protein [Planctomycetota bacterium]
MFQRLKRCAAALLCLITVAAQAQDAAPTGTSLSGADLRIAWESYQVLMAPESHLADITEARAALAKAESEGAPKSKLRSAKNLVRNLTFSADIWDFRKKLKKARRILSAHDASAVASLGWDEAHGYIKDLAYEYDAAKRVELMQKLDPLRRAIAERLVALFPPLVAYDAPNDAGKKIIVGWPRRSGAAGLIVTRIDLSDSDFEPGSESDDDAWEELSTPGPRSMSLSNDDNPVIFGHRYKYRLYEVDADGAKTLVATTDAVTAAGSMFNTGRISFLFIAAFFCGSVMFYIQLAARGTELNIRKIAGLEAIDEAVGRATEMGRPILFIPGIQDMNDIQTVAGLTILGHVAKTAAEHDAQLLVPTSRSLVMTVARETVAASYLSAGRPDAYDEKKIYYVTDEQFGYVAYLSGMMVREKPAACFYMGAFYAESLILAETGNHIGAIQIAGTAMPAQLPFFVAACDYTLIGEEFFAASAYLSGSAEELGSLKGQDVGKVIVVVLMFIGISLLTLSAMLGPDSGLGGTLSDMADFLKNVILT